MFKNLRNLAVGGIVSLAFVAAIPGLASAENVLRFSNQGDAATLDPHAFNTAVTIMTSLQVYDALVMRDQELKIIPGLAESWSTIDDNTWEFKLRRGVAFHNGNEFNADDVIFSIKRAQSETSQMKGYVNSIQDVTKIDDYSVRITTDGPSPILLNQLVFIFMMDKEWSEEHDVLTPQNLTEQEETFAVRHVNGTGAFEIEVREPDVKTVFVRNPNWWANDIYEHNVDKVVWTPISNKSTRVASLLSGELDLVIDPPLQDLARIGASNKLRVVSTSQLRAIFFGLDVASDELRHSNVKGNNPFKDVRVRRAIYHAINIEAIRDKIMRGQSIPAGMMIQKPINGYNADWDDNRLPYDPEIAKSLLAEAGYPDGFELQLDCPNNRYNNDEAICQATVGMLGKIGIHVRLNAQPKTQHFPLITGRESDFFMLGWGVVTMDSGFIFDYLMHSDGSWNGSGYGSPEMDAKIEQIRSIIDPEVRNGIIADIWTEVLDDAPYIPLHHQVISWGMSNKVDIPIEPNDMPRFYWATLK